MTASILSLQVGMPKSFEHFNEKQQITETWSSGVYKQSAGSSVIFTTIGIDGDGQDDLKHHGGPDRAVLLFSKSHYSYFEEFIGTAIPDGGFGENVTIDEFLETEICVGDRFKVGESEIEISQPRLPCFKLGRRLGAPEIVEEVLNQRKGGIYARVTREGKVSVGDQFELIDRPNPDWSISRAVDVFLSKAGDLRKELGSVAAISELWRTRCL